MTITDQDPIKIIPKNIKICLKLNKDLKKRYIEANHNLKEQIQFYKTIKSQFYAELSFQRSALQYFQTKFSGPPKTIKAKIYELMDEIYFTHRPYDPKVHPHLEFPTDPDFISPADNTLSILLATDKFQRLLTGELMSLKTTKLVPAVDTIRIEANGDYAVLVTAEKQYLSNYGISALEKKLGPQLSTRVHRSAMINVNYIKEVYKYLSVYEVVMTNSEVVKVSRSYLENIRKFMV